MGTQQHLPSVNHSARDLYAQHVGEATNPRCLRLRQHLLLALRRERVRHDVRGARLLDLLRRILPDPSSVMAR